MPAIAATGARARTVLWGAGAEARGRRHRHPGGTQRAAQLSIFGAICVHLLAGRFGLVTIPAVLIDGGVQGRATFLKLLVELGQPLQLRLLFRRYLCLGRVGGRTLSYRARRHAQ
jgi:hypothetical protein